MVRTFPGKGRAGRMGRMPYPNPLVGGGFQSGTGGGFQGRFNGDRAGQRRNGNRPKNDGDFNNRHEERQDVIKEHPTLQEQMRLARPEEVAQPIIQPVRQPRRNDDSRPVGREEGGWFRAEE
jgi:hypothetical protein